MSDITKDFFKWEKENIVKRPTVEDILMPYAEDIWQLIDAEKRSRIDVYNFFKYKKIINCNYSHFCEVCNKLFDDYIVDTEIRKCNELQKERRMNDQSE